MTFGFLLTISITGPGCQEKDEAKPDYITVVVSSSIETLTCLPDGTNYQTDDPYQFRLEMIKAGGERFVFDLTSSNGWTDIKKGSFKLYREQFIDVVASIQGGTWDRNTRTLFWKDVYPTKDFGEEYFWIAHVSLCVTDE
ncbi:MAG: hypothetical protein P8100_04875 [bacterium]